MKNLKADKYNANVGFSDCSKENDRICRSGKFPSNNWMTFSNNTEEWVKNKQISSFSQLRGLHAKPQKRFSSFL